MNQFLEFPNPHLYNEMDWIVLDFETHNLDKGDSRNPENFICLGVAITSDGDYIPLAFPDDTQRLRRLLEGRILIAHNAKFELGWLHKLFSSDYVPPLVFDTLMAEKVLAGNRSWPLDLDSVSLKYGGSVKSRYIKALMEKGTSPAQMPQGPLLAYCKGDCENTAIVFREQLKLLNQEGLLPVFYTRCLLLWPLVDIEANGIQLDKERVELEYEQSIKEQSHVLQQLDEYLDGANPNSPKQLAHILYDILGFEELKRADGAPQRTPSGSRKADRPTLNLLRARTQTQSNFIRLAKSRSKLEKKITGYLNKFRSACSNSHGRIYASLSQVNPRTHRLSSQGGAHRVQFQNMDRTLKRLVCPTEPGNIIGEADQAQLEFRVAAFLTQDPQAIGDIKNEVDVHSITRRFLEDAGQHQSRTDSKPVTFRPVYGGTGGSKAEREYCKFFKDKYNTMFREQMKWEAEVLRSSDHSLKTASGLKFFWPQVGIRRDGYATDHSSIFNYPVQSLATADILPIGLIYLWYEIKDRGLTSRLINTVHDSVVWEGPKEEEEIMKDLCQRNMTSRVIWYLETVYSIKFNVPLKIEISIGSHWGEKSSEAQDNEAVSR